MTEACDIDEVCADLEILRTFVAFQVSRFVWLSFFNFLAQAPSDFNQHFWVGHICHEVCQDFCAVLISNLATCDNLRRLAVWRDWKRAEIWREQEELHAFGGIPAHNLAQDAERRIVDDDLAVVVLGLIVALWLEWSDVFNVAELVFLAHPLFYSFEHCWRRETVVGREFWFELVHELLVFGLILIPDWHFHAPRVQHISIPFIRQRVPVPVAILYIVADDDFFLAFFRKIRQQDGRHLLEADGFGGLVALIAC